MSDQPAWEIVLVGTYRLAVPGGWLYLVQADPGPGESVVFVPHPPKAAPEPFHNPQESLLETARQLPPLALPNVLIGPRTDATPRQVAQAAFGWPPSADDYRLQDASQQSGANVICQLPQTVAGQAIAVGPQ